MELGGLHHMTAVTTNAAENVAFYTDVLGLRLVKKTVNQDDVSAYHLFYGDEVGNPGTEITFFDWPHLRRGGVHHIAFRTPDDEEHAAWRENIRRSGLGVTPQIDRYYFRSIYFREPGGVLFEIATDGPGFATDEDTEHLGERLSLPPFLEGRREEIEARLDPIETGGGATQR